MVVPDERAAKAVRQQVASQATAPPLDFSEARGAPDAATRADWRSLVRGMVFGVAAALALYLLISKVLPTVPRARLGTVGKAVLIPGILAAGALAPLVHEIGHVVGGLLVRFRFTMLAWGPLRMVREGDRIRIGLNRNINYIGGIALSLPRTAENLARRTAIVVALGPATSVLLGVAGLIASYMSGIWRSPAAMGDPVRAILGMIAAAFGLSSLGIGLITLVPGRTAGLLTDGAQILRYLRGGPDAERHSALMALVGVSMGPARPRDWPGDLGERLTLGEATDSDIALASSFEEQHGAVMDTSMRTILTDLVALMKAPESRDGSAASTRSQIESVLTATRARSGIDQLKPELITARLEACRPA